MRSPLVAIPAEAFQDLVKPWGFPATQKSSENPIFFIGKMQVFLFLCGQTLGGKKFKTILRNPHIFHGKNAGFPIFLWSNLGRKILRKSSENPIFFMGKMVVFPFFLWQKSRLCHIFSMDPVLFAGDTRIAGSFWRCCVVRRGWSSSFKGGSSRSCELTILHLDGGLEDFFIFPYIGKFIPID